MLESIENSGYSYGDLAKITGIPKSALQRYATGQTTVPIDRVELIANALGTTASSLLGWHTAEKQDLPPDAQRIGRLYTKADDRAREIVEVTLKPFDEGNKAFSQFNEDFAEDLPQNWLKTYAQPSAAGLGNYLDDESYDLINYPDAPPRADIAVRISGNSMEPKYLDGDIVFVETESVLRDGEVGIFCYGGQGFIKKLRTNPARMVSLNPRYRDIPLREGMDFRTVGRVVGVAGR